MEFYFTSDLNKNLHLRPNKCDSILLEFGGNENRYFCPQNQIIWLVSVTLHAGCTYLSMCLFLQRYFIAVRPSKYVVNLLKIYIMKKILNYEDLSMAFPLRPRFSKD